MMATLWQVFSATPSYTRTYLYRPLKPRFTAMEGSGNKMSEQKKYEEIWSLKHRCGEFGKERVCQMPMWSVRTEFRPRLRFH
jgi:hypothetical protein